VNDADYKQLSTTDLLAFFAMIIGMFMAILDIQIVASSLAVVGAGLSASIDELSWVQTSYIIAEVIIIPATGFLSRLLSTRILYFIATCGFTVMSVACSMAWNIESMIVFRALQGLFGGAMIPTAFATSFMIFPPAKRATVSIVIGLVVTMAPTLGPTIGGYITEISSWHLMFIVNVIPGIFVCTVILLYANFDKPNYDLLNNFDYFGVFLMVMSLACTQYVIEEGSRLGWMESDLIICLLCLVIGGLIGLVYTELTVSNPILNLRAFKNKNFSLGCLYSSIIGIGLYGAVYLLPLFLYRIAGMNALQIGIVMIITGMFQFISAPIAGKIYSTGIDKRLMLSIGLILFGFGCYLNSNLTPESRFDEFFLPQAVRGFALMFCFIPVNDIALGTMPRNEVQNASGLYNLTRNLGGAIGLAIINTVLTGNTKRYSQYLNNGITITDADKTLTFYELLNNNVVDPEIASFAMLNQIVQRDAFIIAINNIFIAIALIFIAGLLVLPFANNTQTKIEGH